MADAAPTPPIFEFDLGDKGDRVVAKTPEELKTWLQKENSEWAWLEKGRPWIEQLLGDHQNFRNQAQAYIDTWTGNQANPPALAKPFSRLRSLFEEYYSKSKILHSTSDKAAFLRQLRDKRGPQVAAGAYAALINAPVQTGGQWQTDLLTGLIEGFLYSREVDWTGAAHQEVLNRLKNQYAGNISHQETRFEEIEAKNTELNEGFARALAEKSGALTKLHEEQTNEFQRLVGEHVKNFTNIEKTYDQKLALQKPVKYWKTKEDFHSSKAKHFSIGAAVAGGLLGAGLGFLCWWAFSGLGPADNPKHWQVGVIVVAAFFSIWIVRLLVRMFLSHLHLGTDAAERRVMILTYLSMSREGAQFTPDDKKLIVQHLFRSASDGLVKDDAAPPTLFEMLTRK